MFSHIKNTNNKNEKVLIYFKLIHFFFVSHKSLVFVCSNFKIIRFEDPSELKKHLDLDIPEDPLSLDIIVRDCQQTIDHAVKTGITKTTKMR